MAMAKDFSGRGAMETPGGRKIQGAIPVERERSRGFRRDAATYVAFI
jgi:hypothetical protein